MHEPIRHFHILVEPQPYLRQHLRVLMYTLPLMMDGNLISPPKQLVFTEVDVPKGNEPYAPSAEISMSAAQTLMDQLWVCGLRPTQSDTNAGALSALKDHLKDLQKINDQLLAHHFGTAQFTDSATPGA